MTHFRFKICREPCDECPFVGRFFMESYQLRGILEDMEAKQTFFLCHKTTRDGGTSVVYDKAAVCAGWLAASRNRGYVPQIIQLAERLDLVEESAPPTDPTF